MCSPAKWTRSSRLEEKESCFLVCVSQCLRCLQMAPDGGKHSLDQFMEVRGDCQISRGGQTIEQPLVSVDRHAEELRSNAADNSGLHDRSGLLLDGDANGTAGGNYVRTFTIGAASQPPTEEQ